MGRKMRKSLGPKRKELAGEDIDAITRLFGCFTAMEKDGRPVSRIFRNRGFGYHSITVERPLRDGKGEPALGQKGKLKPDSALEDSLCHRSPKLGGGALECSGKGSLRAATELLGRWSVRGVVVLKGGGFDAEGEAGI